jgi:hypothetical protein
MCYDFACCLSRHASGGKCWECGGVANFLFRCLPGGDADDINRAGCTPPQITLCVMRHVCILHTCVRFLCACRPVQTLELAPSSPLVCCTMSVCSVSVFCPQILELEVKRVQHREEERRKRQAERDRDVKSGALVETDGTRRDRVREVRRCESVRPLLEGADVLGQAGGTQGYNACACVRACIWESVVLRCEVRQCVLNTCGCQPALSSTVCVTADARVHCFADVGMPLVNGACMLQCCVHTTLDHDVPCSLAAALCAHAGS